MENKTSLTLEYDLPVIYLLVWRKMTGGGDGARKMMIMMLVGRRKAWKKWICLKKTHSWNAAREKERKWRYFFPHYFHVWIQEEINSGSFQLYLSIGTSGRRKTLTPKSIHKKISNVWRHRPKYFHKFKYFILLIIFCMTIFNLSPWKNPT